MLVKWDADFQFATPGKRLISFVEAPPASARAARSSRFFVSETRFNSSTNSYTCTVEEGTLQVSHLQGHVPDKTWGQPSPDVKECHCPPPFGPNVPTGLTIMWTANPAYAGTHGELPFSDPWWKILAIIIAVIAALVAIIAAALGAGKASFSVGGTFEETDPSVKCCTPKGAGSGVPEFTVAGVASAIASGAIVVACTDAADPFFHGQEATPPAVGELTVAERVVAKWSLPEAPNAGKAYSADVSWTYERFTTGATYTHAVTETVVNVHVAGEVEIETPAVVHAFDPLWLRTKFQKKEGGYFAGTDLYAFVLFQAPQGLLFVEPLTDDGLGFDPNANDGIYAGSLDLERARRILLSQDQDVFGVWRLYVFRRT